MRSVRGAHADRFEAVRRNGAAEVVPHPRVLSQGTAPSRRTRPPAPAMDRPRDEARLQTPSRVSTSTLNCGWTFGSRVSAPAATFNERRPVAFRRENGFVEIVSFHALRVGQNNRPTRRDLPPPHHAGRSNASAGQSAGWAAHRFERAGQSIVPPAMDRTSRPPARSIGIPTRVLPAHGTLSR